MSMGRPREHNPKQKGLRIQENQVQVIKLTAYVYIGTEPTAGTWVVS